MSAEEADQPRPGVSWSQVAASALAAVTSAVLLSTLGVAGTVIGAAVGSIAVTVGTAIYKHWLEVSRRRVVSQAVALRRVSQAREHVERAAEALGEGGPTPDATLRRADRALGKAEQELEQAPAGDTLTEAPAEGASGIPWRRIALVAAAIFVVVMLAITAFELITGRAVSTYTGGSSRGTGSTLGVGGNHPAKPSAPTGAPTPTSTPTPTSQEPSPSPSASPSAEPSPTQPTLAPPTLTPTETATTAPAQ